MHDRSGKREDEFVRRIRYDDGIWRRARIPILIAMTHDEHNAKSKVTGSDRALFKERAWIIDRGRAQCEDDRWLAILQKLPEFRSQYPSPGTIERKSADPGLARPIRLGIAEHSRKEPK